MDNIKKKKKSKSIVLKIKNTKKAIICTEPKILCFA